MAIWTAAIYEDFKVMPDIKRKAQVYSYLNEEISKIDLTGV
jgi:hypothetical protein